MKLENEFTLLEFSAEGNLLRLASKLPERDFLAEGGCPLMRGWICIINRKRYKKSSIRIMITLCLITVHIPSKDLIKRPF